jgi:U4/U6.U5 tri-snRNP-associated protein 3
VREEKEQGKKKEEEEEKEEEKEEDEEKTQEQLEEEEMMRKVMGFTHFNTTKGKHVPGIEGAVKIGKPKRYRQYMNRRGGFNRQLDPIK